jgi:hypothetical protein
MYALSLRIWHKTINLYDPHGILGETLFGHRLDIEYIDALGFLLVKLDEPWVLNPPVRRVEIIQRVKKSVP